MRLVWEKGIRKLRIQSDSRAVVEMLIKRNFGTNHHASLIGQFAELASREWQTSVHHIYHKANFAMDYLANLGHSFDLGIHFFDFSDVALR
ncbi:hypothetical protein LINPERHAP2_LOCUS32617 [Linum perenne]